MLLLALTVIASIQGLRNSPRPRELPGHVLVVGPAELYTDIQPAVDAALDGDTVFVKPGPTYTGFTIQDKSVSVVVEAGPHAYVSGPVEVKDLAPTRSVFIAGIDVVFSPADRPALVARNNSGSVRIQHFSAYASDGFSGASLEDNADVALLVCNLRGSYGADGSFNTDGAPGGAGLSAISSNIAVYDCWLQGGTGGAGGLGHSNLPAGNGGPGGAGVQVDGGFVYVAGSQILGGDGGFGGDSGLCADGGNAGNGGPGASGIQFIGAAGPQPDVATLGNSFWLGHGGAKGYATLEGPGGSCWEDGVPGPDATFAIDAPPGAAVELSGAPRRFQGPRVARENTFVSVTCRGEPGDLAQVFSTPALGFSYAQNLHGVVLGMAQSRLLASGTIPASGVLSFQIPLPSRGSEASPWRLQGYFRDPSNQRFVASQIMLIELDANY
jgi:hypothetical protein